MPMRFHLETHHEGDVVVATARGALENANVSEAREALKHLRAYDGRDVVLDLSHLAEIDEDGLRMLADETRAFADAGGRLRIVAPDEVADLARRLELSLEIFPTVDAALA